jgi:endonuclease YncB( thermonuclease family)
MRLISFARVAAALLALAGALPAVAQDGQTVTGAAVAIDGDILKFPDNKRVILWGIDAPDRNQKCQIDGADFSCYEAAFRLLDTLAARGDVTCRLVGDPDRLGRASGVCTTVDGLEMNAEMIKEGAAPAYVPQTEDYVALEGEAKAAGVGLWQKGMAFDLPWKFRAARGAGLR